MNELLKQERARFFVKNARNPCENMGFLKFKDFNIEYFNPNSLCEREIRQYNRKRTSQQPDNQ